MKTMKILSYVICGLGLLGSVILLTEGATADAIMGFGVYGFFLALTVNIK